ncbi:MAG TPA: chloride channel protein [Pirellulales bacterium]|jgi:CIC family chloride channel protein|nr:chloride channel protein [Pirellulales bacterium]
MEATEPSKSAWATPLHWLADFSDAVRRRLKPQRRLLGLALVVGVVAGLGAVAFYALSQGVMHYTLESIAGYTPEPTRGENQLFPESDTLFRPWLLLLIPAIGGLASGWLVFTMAPEAEGHGTDSVIAAYHNKQGDIRARVPIVKIFSSALTLGTGGSGGREGPIAQIGAGFGSLLGRTLRLRPADRRILVAAGMGAGISAIFRVPLTGALFAAEVLYSSPDFESEVVIPAGLASVTAYSTFGLFYGWKSMFSLPPSVVSTLTFNNPMRLLSYLALALLMVVLAMMYTRTFYGLSHMFHRLKIRPHYKPAVGAFVTGLLGVGVFIAFTHMVSAADAHRVLAVMAFGDGILQSAMELPAATEGSLVFAALLATVAVVKILTTGLTIGSGGSGGVFGPSLVIGGCAGGALGIALHHFWPALAPHPATFVLVGMAGFLAATAKTPICTLVIVAEMTGSYSLLLPTLWVCALSFLLSDDKSIYGSQVESRSLSPAHQGDYVREVLAGLSVGQFITPRGQIPVLRPGDPLSVVIQRLSSTPFYSLPVADANERLLGVVSLEEVHQASQSPDLGTWIVAADLMRGDITPLRADDRLDRALELFVENDLPALPVVDKFIDGRIVGIVKRSDVATTYLRHVHEVGDNSKKLGGNSKAG